MNQEKSTTTNIIGKPTALTGISRSQVARATRAEIPTENVAHAVLIQSPIARGRIRSIDTQS